MGSREIKAGRAFVEILAKANLTRGLSAAGAQLKNWGQGLAARGAGITAIGAALGGPLALATQHFVQAGSDLDDMAQRTGASAAALSELGYAAALSGTDLATVEGALAKLQNKIGEGSKTFADLGLNLDQLRSMSPTEQLAAVADLLAQIDDPAKRTAAAMDLLGKSGTALIPMLSGGAAGLAAMADEGRRLGVVMSAADVSAAAELGDQFDRLGKLGDGLKNKIGAALAPSLIDAAEYLVDAGAAANQFIDQNRGLVVAVGATAAGLVVTGAAVTALGGTLYVAGLGLTTLAGGLAAVTSPLGLTAAALAGGTYAWATYTTAGRQATADIGAALGELRTTAEGSFAGIADALAAGDLALAGETALAGLKVAWLQGLQALEQLTGPALADVAQLFTSGQFAEAATVAWARISEAAELSALDVAIAWEEFAAGTAQLWDDFTNQGLAAFEAIERGAANWLQSPAGQKLTSWIVNNTFDPNTAEGRLRATATNMGLQGTLSTYAAGVNAGTAANAQARETASREASAARGAALAQRKTALESRRDALAGQANQARPDLAAGRSADALAAAQDALANARQAAQDAADDAAAARRDKALEDATKRQGRIPQEKGPLGPLTASTFSAQAAALLGLGGGRAADKAAEAAEDTADNTAKIVDELKRFNRRPQDAPALAWGD